jgi:hypothetical protein
MCTILGPVAIIVHTLLVMALRLLIFHFLDESVKIEGFCKRNFGVIKI